MAFIPAYCAKCKSIFPFRAMEIGEGVTIGISNIATNCPICGGTAMVSEGIFKSTKDAMELISGPDTTRAMLETLRLIAEKASSGQLNQDEAIKQASELSPKFGALFEVFIKLGMPALALLITMIGVYLQREGNRSSSDDAKKILDAITAQTFSMKEINSKNRIEKNSGAPSNKKPDAKTISTKRPSCRRTDVQRKRREDLKAFRQAIGKSRTH